MNAAAIQLDMTKPASRRPLTGFDIEQWRLDLNLSKYDAQVALGFRNSNHYNKMCMEPILPVALELLLRLYEEAPCARGWEAYTMRELFDLMYGENLAVFHNTRHEVYAKVDLGVRFTRIFDRSSARHYEWLEAAATKNDRELNAYSVMACILSKLKQVKDPKEVLDRLSKRVWTLRGVDLDAECPIPTLANPPTREKTGRKSAKAIARPKPKAPLKRAKKAAAKKPKKVAAKATTRPAAKKTATRKRAPA
jgi:hypothetical protein